MSNTFWADVRRSMARESKHGCDQAVANVLSTDEIKRLRWIEDAVTSFLADFENPQRGRSKLAEADTFVTIMRMIIPPTSN